MTAYNISSNFNWQSQEKVVLSSLKAGSHGPMNISKWGNDHFPFSLKTSAYKLVSSVFILWWGRPLTILFNFGLRTLPLDYYNNVSRFFWDRQNMHPGSVIGVYGLLYFNDPLNYITCSQNCTTKPSSNALNPYPILGEL